MKKENPRIKLFCAVPYEGFEKNWSKKWRRLYNEVISAADCVKMFHPAFTCIAFQERNRYMVDHSALVIAVYNGGGGGTRNTIEYARRQNVRVHIAKP